VQFEAIHWFVAVLQIVMVQFLVVLIFGHSAFQGVDLFVNRLHFVKQFERNVYSLFAFSMHLIAKASG
jgi:hypothetical protein